MLEAEAARMATLEGLALSREAARQAEVAEAAARVRSLQAHIIAKAEDLQVRLQYGK